MCVSKVENFLRAVGSQRKLPKIPDSIIVEVSLVRGKITGKSLATGLTRIVKHYYTEPIVRYFTGQKSVTVMKGLAVPERYLYICLTN